MKLTRSSLNGPHGEVLGQASVQRLANSVNSPNRSRIAAAHYLAYGMDTSVGATRKDRFHRLVEEVAERRLQLALDGPCPGLELGSREVDPVILEDQGQGSTRFVFPRLPAAHDPFP